MLYPFMQAGLTVALAALQHASKSAQVAVVPVEPPSPPARERTALVARSVTGRDRRATLTENAVVVGVDLSLSARSRGTHGQSFPLPDGVEPSELDELELLDLSLSEWK